MAATPLHTPSAFIGFDEAEPLPSVASPAESAASPIAGRREALRRVAASLAEAQRRTSPWKLGLTVLCFAAAIYLLGPRLFFTESERAVTNAPLVTLRPEFAGTLQTTMSVGRDVADGERVAALSNAAWDPSQLLEVERRLRDAQARAETAGDELTGLAALRKRLQDQYDIWLRSMTQSAELQVTEAENRLQAAQAKLGAAQTNLNRYDRLATASLVNWQRLTDIRRDYAVAVRDANAATAEVEVTKQQQQTIKAGISLGGNDRPPTLQLMNEIDIQLATKSAALAAAQGDVKTYERQRQDMLHLREQQTHIALLSPVQGVVWQVFAHPGDAVPAHAPVASVIDCNRLGLTAIFNQRHVQSLVPNRRVSVHIVGIDETLWGRIVRINGYYRADEREAEAIALKPDESPAVLVSIDLDKPLASCWVGLEATVRLR